MLKIPGLLALCSALAIPGSAMAQTMEFYPINAWNEHKIFLSAAGHTGGGGGGCLNGDPYAMENEIAWMNSRDAADGFNNASGTDIYYEDLSERQYWTMLGWGTFQDNINYSNAFAPQLHLAVHSNGGKTLECSSTNASKFGTWGIYRPDRAYSDLMAQWLTYYVGPASPGTGEKECVDTQCTQHTTLGLAELRNPTAYYVGYLEQEYHSWDTGARWLAYDLTWQWRIAAAADGFLGTPRK